MNKFPHSPTMTWSNTDKAQAQAQGWDVFAVDNDQTNLEIQRLDEAAIFESDEAARKFVEKHKAKWNHCARALKLIKQAQRERAALLKKALPPSKLSRKQKSQARGWEKVRGQLEQRSNQEGRTSQTLTAYSQAIDHCVHAANILREIIEHDEAANAARAKRDLAALQRASSQIEHSANVIFNKTPDGKARP